MINKDNGFDLNIQWRFPGGREYAFAFIVLFAFLIIIYGNSFQGAWLFDDSHNIVENRNIFLKTLDWPDIKKTFYGWEGERVNRPLAYFSFALNYYFGGLNVFGYHVVNFIIHYLSSIFLFLFIYNTLKLAAVRERYGPTSYSIALLAAVFWATSPLQVTAVTYIVQRMASMAGLFYIMAMYFYLKGRTADRPWKYVLYGGLCILSAALCFGVKENAVMLPVSIWLFDLLLVQGATRENVIKNLKLFVPVILVMAAVGLWYVDISSILSGASYKNRTFTLTERLLTQPRVIIFYITLLFYPIGSRLTLLHDVELSKSLLTPWSTMPSIAVIAGLLVLAVYISRKRPLISFCIFFYFINHVVESSFIPLELIYEHRNYIPSMLFFVPLVIFMLRVIDYFSYKKVIQFTMITVFTFLLMAQGHTVSTRNDMFKYPEIFWRDNIRKSPNLSRPHGLLGYVYAMRGDYVSAIMEITVALQLSGYPSIGSPIQDHINLANAYFFSGLNDEMALFHYNEVLRIHPRIVSPCVYDGGWPLIMLNRGNLKLAHEYGQKGIVCAPHNEVSHSNFALILLKEGDLDGTIKEARHAIELEPNYVTPLATLGEAYRQKRYYARSEYYWTEYVRNNPNNITAHLALIELYHLQGKKEKMMPTIGKILSLSPKGNIFDMIKKDENKYFPYTPYPKKLVPILQSAFLQLGRYDSTRPMHREQ